MSLDIIKNIKANIEKVMIGQEDTIKLILTAMLSSGHVLIEDMPGTGKTVLASSLAKSIDGKFSRIQFTPDLLPSDVTGLNFYNQKIGDFVFKEGPAFCNILLADEINRATPRTQSSLLECMAENQITVDGITRNLDKPFIVIATQNPLESLGTFSLPEAQLDRFLMRINMNPPSKDSEIAILKRFMNNTPLEDLEKICSVIEIASIIKEVEKIYIHDLIIEYIAEIAVASRVDSKVEIGISPRGSLALMRAVRAYAYINGREFVVPEDVKYLAVPILAHRIKLAFGSSIFEQKEIIQNLLNKVPITTENWNN